MAASQVVLYFDKQEDALRFTLAASSVIAADESIRGNEALEKVGKEICKARRITAEGMINQEMINDSAPAIDSSSLPASRCA